MTRHDDFTLPIERIASHGSAKTAGWTGLPPGASMKDAVREVLDMIERSGYKIIGNEKTREGMFTLAKKPGKPSGFFVTLFEGNSRTGVAYKEMHEDMGPYAVGPSLRLLKKADPPVNEYAKAWREKALAHAGMRTQKFNPGDLVTVYGEDYVVEGPARRRGQYLIRHEQTDKVYRAKPVTMHRRASHGSAKTALGQATVEAFLMVASSKLTQYDAKLQAKRPNMYRLGHYLEALDKVRGDVRPFLKRDDPEALDALRKALLTRFTSSGGKASLPPINAVLRQISDYLDSGKMPSLTRRASRGQGKTAKHPLDGVRGHQLLPSGVARKIPAIYSQENEDDPIAWVKFFSPYTNATWYITEYDPSSGEAFGWADLGMGGGELGYISVRELEGLQKRGLPLVERDLYWKPRKLSQAKRS